MGTSYFSGIVSRETIVELYQCKARANMFTVDNIDEWFYLGICLIMLVLMFGFCYFCFSEARGLHDEDQEKEKKK